MILWPILLEVIITSQLPNKTGCTCENPGWCERHKCNKPEHMHELCKNNPKYFDAWERGRGPGQKMATMAEKAANFAQAAVVHITTGMKACTPEEKAERYKICSSNQCGYFLAHGENGVCGHSKCGCVIRSGGRIIDKLTWADSKCPVGLWGAIEKNDENPENGV